MDELIISNNINNTHIVKSIRLMLLYNFSFIKHRPSDYGKNSTASYIKTFSDNKGATTKNIDEYVPLIPKPPSFEMALAELNSRVINDDKHNK